MKNGPANAAFKPGLAPTALLWLAVLVSALAVIDTSHRCRQLYASLTELEREENALQVEWGRYLLEASSWASLNRVEAEAREKLGMRIPEIEEMVMVRQ